MPRQGRQPRQQQQQQLGSAQNHAKSTAAVKTKQKAAATKKKQSASNTPAALDVYSFQPTQKRARGDVDPQARASAAAKRGRKGKPKQKQAIGGERDDDDKDSEVEQDSDEDDQAMFRGGGIVEFTGIKPKGLKMGLDSGNEGRGDDDDDDDDDEDIDSDEAGGDSDMSDDDDDDDEDDQPKKKSGNKKQSQRSAPVSTEIDLDENEIDWDDEDGEGCMDLADVLDNGEFASDDGDEEDEDDEDESDSDDEEEDSEIESDEGDEYAGLDKLSSFVEGLDNKKRKIDDIEGQDSKKKKRVVLKERTEAYPEGEFVAVDARTRDGKVDLDDLLSTFSDSKNPRLAALRKTLKPLSVSSGSGSATPVATSAKSILKSAGPLAAPLPGRLQDKIDREAAFEKTKEETDKWNDTVRRMKGASGLGVEGARHERLTLPLMGGAGDVRRDPNAAEWSAKFQPTNELEASIQSLLAAGQMSQADLQKAEKEALATLDPADVAARQAELRQQRDLMYRAERKAKRVAKIKSKAYRRIHRKLKGKSGANGLDGLSLEDLAEMDKLDGGDRVAEQTARMEIDRARERATLKHSSKGGRWSRTDIGGLEGLDAERNSAVRDMAARNEQLRRRIAGVGDDDASADEFDSGSSGADSEADEDRDIDDIRRDAMDELKSLEAKERALAANAPKLKGVVGMKFMQDAIKRGERQAQLQADELQGSLERIGQQAERGLDHENNDEDEEPLAMSEQVQGNLGRLVFGPSATKAGASSAPAASLIPASAKSALHTTKLTAPLAMESGYASSSRSPIVTAATASPSTANNDESNPWMTVQEDGSGSRLSRKSNKATFGKDARDATRVADKTARHKAKQMDAREAELNDAQVDLDPTSMLASTSTKRRDVPQIGTAPVAANGKAVARPAPQDDSEDGSGDEDDDEAIDAQRGKGPAAFKQRELVAKAFAGDNVVADFEAEKRREIERDAPRVEDNTLPGWGAWGGKGAKKKKNAKKFVTHVPGIAPEARQDAKFSHVIISEKKDKKASKYLLKDLPFPYTSAAQHEHKLRTPMGPEWSTSTILRDQTLPSVLIKPGVTIRPVDKKV